MTRERRLVLACIAAFVCAEIAFAPAAFRIDEPNIVAIARQAAAHPGDPYGFTINWLGTRDPAFKILANPPLVPYWLSVWGRLFGWGEIPLHLSILPFSVVALLAMASLARSFNTNVPLAVACLICSPAFFVGAQTVMPDVAMLSMLMLTVAAALRYAENGGRGLLIVAAVAAAVTPLLKYNGVIVIGLLGYLAVIHRHRRAGLVAVACAPIASLLAWAVISRAIYGQSHFGASASLQQIASGDMMTGALAAIGIGVIPLALAVTTRPALLGAAADRVVWVGVGLMSLAAGLFLLNYPISSALAFGISCAVAVRFLITTLVDGLSVWPEKAWGRGLLVLWVAGTIALQFHLIFTSVRYVLPLLPTAILLLLPRSPLTTRPRLASAVLVLNFALAISIGAGDALIANVPRHFVREVVVPLRARERGALFFAGHWGFQWYMQAAGGTAVEGGIPPRLAPGDVLVVAHTPFPQLDLPPTQKNLEVMHYPYGVVFPIHTVDCWANANFYGNGIGSCRRPASVTYLPWAFSTSPVEQFDVYSVKR
jgi:4-amino-4-deoxy-L-arabinose transferase-like glycosyltransferase